MSRTKLSKRFSVERLEDRCLLASSNGLIAFGSFDAVDGPFAARLFTVDPAVGPASAACIQTGGVCGPQGDGDPAWSRDGSKLLFVRGGFAEELWIMNADGSDPLPVRDSLGNAVSGRTPTWVGIGTGAISYAAVVGSTYDIFYANLSYFADHIEVSNPINITNHPNNDFSPSWNPDSSQLVFDTDRGSAGGGDIYLIANPFDPSPTATNLTPNTSTSFDARPDWSPDGTKIVFVSNFSGSDDIWVMNTDGSNEQNLTNDAISDDAPAWSPDGTKIVFSSSRPVPGAAVQDTDAEIFVMNANGGGLNAVTSNDADTFDWTPDWQPIPELPARFHFRAASFTADENDGTARVRVDRTGRTDTAVSVDFNTLIAFGDAAIDGEDFVGVHTTLDFAADETSKLVEIEILLDELSEPDETFTLDLSNPSDGGELDSPSSAKLTIVNVDPVADVSVSIAAPGLVTQGSEFTYTVTISNDGPDAAINAFLSHPLPADTTFVRVAGEGCNESNGFILCNRSRLSNGSSQSASVTIIPNSAGSLTLTALAVSDSEDPVNNNTVDPPVSVAVRPANDDFAAAQHLVGSHGEFIPGSNRNATAENSILGSPERNHFGEYAPRKSVWYDWTPSYTSLTSFTTIQSDPFPFDTLLAVYTRRAAGGPLVQEASDDDHAGDSKSIVDFVALAGQTYYVAVDGFDGREGTIKLSWFQGDEIILAPVQQVVESLDPPTVNAGTGSEVIVVRGTGFTAESRVLVNGELRPTVVFMEGGTLSLGVELAATDKAFPGVAQISVRNDDSVSQVDRNSTLLIGNYLTVTGNSSGQTRSLLSTGKPEPLIEWVQQCNEVDFCFSSLAVIKTPEGQFCDRASICSPTLFQYQLARGLYCDADFCDDSLEGYRLSHNGQDPRDPAIPGPAVGNSTFTIAPASTLQIGAVTIGPGSIIPEGAMLIGQDGAGLIGQDGAGLLDTLKAMGVVANDGAGVVANDGAGIVAGGGGNIVAGGGGNFAPRFAAFTDSQDTAVASTRAAREAGPNSAWVVVHGSGGAMPTITNTDNGDGTITGTVGLTFDDTSTPSLADLAAHGMVFAIVMPDTVSFSAASYSVSEDGTQATITVTRTGELIGEVAIDFAATSGSATAGSDFTATSGTLLFDDAEATKTFTVPVLRDAASELVETINLTLSNPQGIVRVGGQGTSVLNITADVTPPKIQNMTMVSDTKGISQILLTANEPLLPGSVTNAAGYSVKLVVRNKKTGVTTFTPIALRPASLDATGRIVTLTPVSAIKLNQFIQIAALGATGPTDLGGNHIDGNGDGTAGDDYTTTVGRGTSLAYTDRNGDAVTLKLSGGGVMELTRAADGDGKQLTLLNTVPNKSALSGTVKKPKSGGGDNLTTLGSIMGINATTRVQNSLPINPPSPTTGRFVIGSIASVVVDAILESGSLGPGSSLAQHESATRMPTRLH